MRVRRWAWSAALVLALGAAGVAAGIAALDSGEEPAAACPAAPAAPRATLRPAAAGPPELLRAAVVTRHPHDESAFTEGLAYAGGDELYEGTGEDSDVRRVAIGSGAVLVRKALAAPLFGEGVALADGRVVQLTWQDGVGFVRDRCTLAGSGGFRYAGEGWGLTYDGRLLWQSDGTDVLQARDPRTYRVVRRLSVRDRGVPLRRLNELEYVDGALLANVWKTDWVARIDARSGVVTGWVDASALAAAARPRGDPEAVLNGIAGDPATGRLWMTGKRWPALFEVRLERADGRLPPPGPGG